MRPDNKTDHTDRNHGISHAEIAEYGFFGEGGDDLADHAEARDNEDVDLGMAEEPEQMLPEQRIAALGRVEERGAEVPVGKQHGDGTGEHR